MAGETKDITVDGNLTDVATVTDSMRLLIVDTGVLKDVDASVLKAYTDVTADAGGYFTATDKDGILQEVGAKLKMPIQAGTFNNTVVASTTYYYGGVFGGTMGTAALSRRIYVRKACTLVAIDTIFTYGASPSNHAATLSFRLNNTTDYAVSSSIDFSAGTPLFVSKTDFAVAIADGDYFEMKLAFGAMTTVPTALSVSTVCWFL